MRLAYSASSIALRQWPVAFATAMPPAKSATTSAAKTTGRTATGHGRGASTRSARGTGHAATHERQAKHSSEQTRASRSTGRREGQAFVHRPQSMQEGAWRVTL